MFFKKKKKTVEEHYHNELMRSRMSDISIRTDEIIQQFFYVAKDESLTLDEYLKIRELATKELGLTKEKEVETPTNFNEKPQVEQACLVASTLKAEKPESIAENNEKVDRKSPELVHEPPRSHRVDDFDAVMSVPFTVEKPTESHAEPPRESQKKEEAFDFLAMLQSVED